VAGFGADLDQSLLWSLWDAVQNVTPRIYSNLSWNVACSVHGDVWANDGVANDGRLGPLNACCMCVDRKAAGCAMMGLYARNNAFVVVGLAVLTVICIIAVVRLLR
jgi:hypothetical protein